MVWQDEHGIRHENCAAFFKVAEDFGGLSNMHNGYPVRVNGMRIGSSEALFQACRFPHHPDIQREIIAAPHAMVAKMKAKKDCRRERFTRPDWDDVRVEVMRWCLAIKLACHPQTFAALLLSTGNRPIVERSRRDDFWGAKLVGHVLVGRDVLGQLLMALRAELRQTADLRTVAPLAIPDFGLLGEPIGAVDQRSVICA
jgi:ribA/ribD-fused uncharacterized protein